MDNLILQLALHITIFIFLSATISATLFFFVFKKDGSAVILSISLSVSNCIVIYNIIKTLIEVLQ